MALIGPYPPPYGGISVFMKNLRSFIDRHFNVEIWIINELEKEEPVNHILALGRNSRLRYILRLFRYLRKIRPQLIYYNGPHGLARFLLAVYSRWTNIPLILHLHGMSAIDFYKKNILTRRMSKYTFQNADQIIAVNSYISSFLKNKGWASPFTLPPLLPSGDNPVITSRQMEFINSLPAEKKYFLSYGTLDTNSQGEYIYGIDRLLQTFGMYPGEEHLILVIILKDQSQKKIYNQFIQPLVDSLPYKHRIHIYTHEGQESLYPFYRKASAFIRWTTEDGDPLSIHEAMEAGLSVFATDIAPRPERVIVFNPRSPQIIFKAKNSVNKQMGKNISNQIQKKYFEILSYWLSPKKAIT